MDVRLPRAMVQLLFLEAFKRCVDVVLRDMVSCRTWQLMVGFNGLGFHGLRGLFQPT